MTKKKKVTIGYKKLKNVDSFDQFDINKEELQGGVNESNSMFSSDLESVWNSLNILYTLNDEGYMNDNGSLKSNSADAVDFIDAEMGMDMSDDWDSEGGFDAWVQSTMDEIREFGSKY